MGKSEIESEYIEGLLVVSDRGGHWHNAEMLLRNMKISPQWIVTTYGPDIDALKKKNISTKVCSVPYLFSWVGQTRIFNPIAAILHIGVSFYWAKKLKPKKVISLGATNVVFFCYFAHMFGAEITHVECMNQVVNPSITGRLLYRVSHRFFVQWPELLKVYGPKADYQGWVL